MITFDRAELLADYLSDVRNLEIMQSPTVEEATERINSDGYDFTTDEILSFGKYLDNQFSQEDDALDENILDAVSGGVSLVVLRLLKLIPPPYIGDWGWRRW